MSAKTAKLISPERVKKLFECYGAHPDAWPVDEKVSALSLIHHSSELRELQQEYAEFDRLLKDSDISSGVSALSDSKLLDKIISGLPEQDARADSSFFSRIDNNRGRFFNLNKSFGAIAASVAILAITLSITHLHPEHVKPVSSTIVASSDLDKWMWEQVAGDVEEDSDDRISMMTLLELEEI